MELSDGIHLNPSEVLVSRADAPSTARGRIAPARCVVEDAEGFQVWHTAAHRWGPTRIGDRLRMHPRPRARS